jgi:hypothetical protein
MLDHPEFDMLMEDFQPRFNESPWSPEVLEAPDPSTITGQIDMLKRKVYSVQDTQLMEVITDATDPEAGAQLPR